MLVMTGKVQQEMDFDADTLRAIAQVYKEEGNAAYKKKELIDAIGFYTEGINVNCKDDQLNAILYTNRATSHFSVGNFQEALEDAKRAREFQPAYMKAILRGAKACKELGLYEEAIKWCDEGLTIDEENEALLETKSKSVNEQTNVKTEYQPNVKTIEVAVSRLNQDISIINASSPEEFMNTFVHNLDKEHVDVMEEETAYNNLGITYHKFRDPEKAREMYSFCKVLEDSGRQGESRACRNLSDTYQDNGDLSKAINYYKKCLDLCKNANDKIEEQVICAKLGEAYYRLREYKVALEYYRQCLTLCEDLGDRHGEGKQNARIAVMHWYLSEFRNSIKHFKIFQYICHEGGDQSGEATACGQLGKVLLQIGDIKQAEEYLKKCIQISREVEDEAREEQTWGQLGIAYHMKGNFHQAIECFKRCLTFSQKVRDRALEGTMCDRLGRAYLDVGDIKQAMEYLEKSLSISKEIGYRSLEGDAYGHLGYAHSFLGNYKLAIQYHKQCLAICKELRDRYGELAVYKHLGIAYCKSGDFKPAIGFLQESLKMSQEIRTKEGEVCAFANLADAYRSVGDFKQAVECSSRSLTICREQGYRSFEGATLGSLGATLFALGDTKEAIKCYNRNLAICKESGDKAGEGHMYGNLSMAYQDLGKYEDATNYNKKHLSIFRELGYRAEEGVAYRDLGNIQRSLGDFEQAKENYNKYAAISKEIGNRALEGDACLHLTLLMFSLGDVQQAMDFSKQHLIICKETGSMSGEGIAYVIQGCCLQSLGRLEDALVLYQSSVQQFNRLRSLLHTKDRFKISLRNECGAAYMKLWKVLLQLDRTEEALQAAERGRAQALVDLLVSQYGFELCQQDQISRAETASDLLASAPCNTLFLAVYRNEINMWFLQNGENIQLSEQNINASFLSSNAGEDLDSFIKNTYKEIGVRSNENCEDRTLDALPNMGDLTVQELDLSIPSIGKSLRKTEEDSKTESATPPPVRKSCLSALYDAVVAPVIPYLRGNELVIVPDGQLFLFPFAALQDDNFRYLCESFRIRVTPSLTCLKMIMNSPPDYHCKSSALIVGDPWLQEVVDILGVPKIDQLPCARKEAEMIGAIVKSTPLIGSDATKEEVLKRLNSVALIHFAAHGRIETGEIALAPNTSRKSQIPREEDFLLKMSDVLSVGLRARLVVLSCCHSGRGEIKDEGVVGIARAFLGAGARSVVVSLWAIEDKSTLEFMRVFYQHLVEGKKASEALNFATNYMRESKDFGKICQWAPFVLIGDDVTLECLEEKWMT